MKIGIELRLACFGLAIVLVALTIVWAALTTWQEARRLKMKFSTVQVESFQIADHFQATILDLNDMLVHYDTRRQADDWNNFVRVSEELDRWIDVQSAKLRNPRERWLLDKINEAYDIYRGDAHHITNQTLRATATGSSLGMLEKIELQTRHLLNLGNQLADAHREVVGQWIATTQKSLTFLQQLIFGLLLLLLALGAWLAVEVYREMIAPLRVKLIESRAIIERQEKLASLGVLAAGVAHEIRNPLTAIKARLFTQQKTLPETSPGYEDARVIGDEINRLEKIVRDFLLFAQPAEPALVTLNARAPLQEVQELLGPHLEKSAVTLTVDSVADANIRADPQQLKQVLINLIQNAAESIGQRGAITLRAREGWVPLAGRVTSAVVLEVEDTGKGIRPEVQKRLFDPFFTTKDAGTGLGLSIAARIVQKHGGALEYQTKLNRGTTFGVILPRA